MSTKRRSRIKTSEVPRKEKLSHPPRNLGCPLFHRSVTFILWGASVDDVRGHQASRSATSHSKAARRFVHGSNHAFRNPERRLETPVLRNTAIAPAGFSASRFGSQRCFCTIPNGHRQCRSQDRLDRSLDRTRQSEGSRDGRKTGAGTQTAAEEHQREQQELASINARWEKL